MTDLRDKGNAKSTPVKAFSIFLAHLKQKNDNARIQTNRSRIRTRAARAMPRTFAPKTQ